MNLEIKVDLNKLDDHLVDINGNNIPNHVLDSFYAIKKEIGSRPMGIAHFPEEGWYIVDSMGKVFGYLNK